MASPLFASTDRVLLDELHRLAAAAGVSPDVATDPAATLRRWAAASMVVLGVDLAADMVLLSPARRDGVHLVAVGALPADAFRVALALGARSVSDLPRSAAWITDTLTDAGDSGRARGLTVGVVGGSGGAGATTLACALGQAAAREGPAVVVDLDPRGPGVDRVLAMEAVDGVRWDALARSAGRLSSRALREALPRRERLAVLTWGAAAASGPPPIDPVAVREAVSAAQRGHDTVVVDVPRSVGRVLDPGVDDVLSRCDLVVVVVRPTVSGTASALRVVGSLAEAHDRARLRLVVRGAGADPASVARVVGVPVLTSMPDQRGLAEAIDLGLGPVRSWRGPLGRAAAEILDGSALLVPASRLVA